MVEELGQAKATKLVKYEGVVSLTREQAKEIVKTIWPKAPEIEVLKAAIICHQYGLNPLMKHLFLIPFKRKEQGKVVGEDWVAVLGIKTNRLIAQRRHSYSYLDLTPRRMTEQEQEKVLGEVDDSRIWAITMIKDMDTSAEVMGVGSWPKDEVPYGVEKGNTKLNMACIRSERQALDRQYPGEMPQGVEVIDEEYLPIEGKSFIRLPEGDEKGDEQVVTQPGGVGGTEQTTVLSPKGKKGKTTASVPAVEPAIEGEGFHIELAWLEQTLKAIHWDEDTARSWATGNLKVDAKGKITDWLPLVNREQAERFVHELEERSAKAQPGLFD